MSKYIQNGVRLAFTYPISKGGWLLPQKTYLKLQALEFENNALQHPTAFANLGTQVANLVLFRLVFSISNDYLLHGCELSRGVLDSLELRSSRVLKVSPFLSNDVSLVPARSQCPSPLFSPSRSLTLVRRSQPAASELLQQAIVWT